MAAGWTFVPAERQPASTSQGQTGDPHVASVQRRASDRQDELKGCLDKWPSQCGAGQTGGLDKCSRQRGASQKKTDQRLNLGVTIVCF